MPPDERILPDVRAEVAAAEQHLRAAIDLFANNGWPENARELARALRHVGTWTQAGGWLDHLEKPQIDPCPEGVQGDE